MAEAALISFEGSASWSRAFDATVEFAADEWEIKATKAQAATAVAIAKTWLNKASRKLFIVRQSNDTQ